ncbi:MAG: hypothetical protein M2R45_04597 [Verrucomicrobia subdivision 3 bacterium]|nr:hypothetical protein [Limisphaerales bacterium]MCS1417340.1 hypothetical protein [Limisphaerales bacterium]
MPANYYNGAARFSFADGHVEIRKWKDPYTLFEDNFGRASRSE